MNTILLIFVLVALSKFTYYDIKEFIEEGYTKKISEEKLKLIYDVDELKLDFSYRPSYNTLKLLYDNKNIVKKNIKEYFKKTIIKNI